MLNPIVLKGLNFYPEGNISRSLYASTQMLSNDSDQGGFRFDHNFSGGDQLFLRYATAITSQIDPLSISGANVPGFPVGDDIRTHSVAASDTHRFSPGTIHTFRAGFFRNMFLFDKRPNRTPPSDLGFQYQPSLALSSGPPFLIVSGYASVGDPITDRGTPTRTPTSSAIRSLWDDNGLQAALHQDGRDFTRNHMNLLFGIATNGFFVFTPFPLSDCFASFLIGQPVVFFQGGGQFDRGLRNIMGAGYAQGEWRITPRLTLNYGLRYEVNTPYVDIRDRMNGWAPGRQSKVFQSAPAGLPFPGDRGMARGHRAELLQKLHGGVGIAWDPAGSDRTTVRAGYGIFYDSFTKAVGGPLQAAVSALPWTEALQFPGPGLNFADPYDGQAQPFASQTFVKPAAILTVDQLMRPPYAKLELVD